MKNANLAIALSSLLISGCILRTDGYSNPTAIISQYENINNMGKIKKDYISMNSWSIEDTKNSVKQVLTRMSASDRFNEIIKNKGVVKVKLGTFADHTKEEGFPVDDIKNELLSEISRDNRIILIEDDNDTLLKEMTYQQDGAVRKSDRKNIGKQLGADLLVFGNISVSKTVELSNLTKNYFATFRITDIESGERVLMTVYKTAKKYTIE